MVRSNVRFMLSPAAFHASPTEAAEAYERSRPDLAALTPEEVGRVRLNPTAVVSTVFGALPVLEALGDDIKGLPHINHPLLGKLYDVTLALYYVSLLVMHASDDKAEVAELLVEGAPLRERLLISAETLVVYGLVDGKQVASIRSGTGHDDTANDLGALAQFYRALDPEVRSKTLVTNADIDRASELSLLVLAALGRRRVGSDGASPTSRYADDKARALRWVVRSYGELRRAVTFLRWHEGDADQLVPSLFAGKRRRSPSADEPTDGPTGEPGEGDDGATDDGTTNEGDVLNAAGAA
jgi:hypothetical protein